MTDVSDRLRSALADRYLLERELGRGGMATVYLAHDLRHDRPIALKVLHPELAHALGPERFLREIRFAARLQHPHIPAVHDSGESAGYLWFTMPYVEGESLRDRLRREKQLPIEEAQRITHEAAQGLQYAHSHGVIHRDIKPENLLLTEDGNTLIADFGVARALAGGEASLTETGLAMGTPTYMSPEQASGARDLDARSDVYSLASVLYEMLAGEPPFTGATPQAVIARRFTENPRPLHTLRETVPRELEAAVARGLAKAPADRFQTVADFARALAQPARTEPVETSATERPRVPTTGVAPAESRARRRVPVAALALGLGFLVGLGVLFAWRRTHPGGNVEAGRSKRLAVLPFESVGDTSDRAFADGMSEEITTRLARVPGLMLVARSSALQYRRSNQTAPQFGRALSVDYVLDGTVRSATGPGGQKQVRITPELIRVADGTHLWSEPYEGVLTDVFRLQADVAGRVAEALGGTLGGGERRAVQRAPTTDLEAYRLYVLGRAEWTRRTPEGLERAAEYFRQAIARDSTFARAWAGLADAYALYQVYGVEAIPRDTAYARARAAALRAIALDSTLAEPHASLNQILRYGYWDWAGSEREVRRAIALDPNYATAHQWLAEHLLDTGHLTEGVAEARTAVRLDPLAPAPNTILGLGLWYWGRSDEAVGVFRTALARDSTAAVLWRNLFLLHLASGRSDDALAMLAARHDTSALARALVRARSDSRARATVLRAVSQSGQQVLIGTFGGGSLGHSRLARLYAFLGEREAALTELGRAVDDREPTLEWLKVDPLLAALHEEPRFAAAVRRIGLPP